MTRRGIVFTCAEGAALCETAHAEAAPATASTAADSSVMIDVLLRLLLLLVLVVVVVSMMTFVIAPAGIGLTRVMHHV